MIYRSYNRKFLILFVLLVIFSTTIFAPYTFAQNTTTPTASTPVSESMDPNYSGDAEGTTPTPTPLPGNGTFSTVPQTKDAVVPEEPNPFSTNTVTDKPAETTPVAQTPPKIENSSIKVVPMAISILCILSGVILLVRKTKKKELTSNIPTVATIKNNAPLNPPKTLEKARDLPVVDPKQIRKSTLLFLYRRKDKHVLLAMKKRGFGKDKYNGVGGKLENNETIEEALVRETREEIRVSVNADDFKEVAVLNFFFKNKSEWDQQVYVFFTEKWEGDPSETDEMNPEWFPVEALPYDKMWIDDKHWLPLVLSGKNIHAAFTFNETGSEILDMQIKKV